MGIITDSGRAAVAEAVKKQPLYLAWGTGSPDWDGQRPSEDEESAALHHEVGRKALHRSLFVLPDDDGDLVASEHSRYSISLEPTKYLYAEFLYDFRDGCGETIRELGIFMGGRVKEGLPPGQTYYLPSEVEEPGTLLMIEHRLQPQERETPQMLHVAYVIPF